MRISNIYSPVFKGKKEGMRNTLIPLPDMGSVLGINRPHIEVLVPVIIEDNAPLLRGDLSYHCTEPPPLR